VGAFILGASTLPFLYNVWSSRRCPMVETDDPWGWGRSLEWATSSPPPRHNFVTIPRIRSESPAFDMRHPTVAAAGLTHVPVSRDGHLADAPGMPDREDTPRERGSGFDEEGATDEE